MPSERNTASENPYEPPQQRSVQQSETPPTEQPWWWAIINAAISLLGTGVIGLWFFREFGNAGLTMMIGGLAGSCFGWWLSKERWWGFATGAAVGFTAGAVFGLVPLFVS